MSTLPFKLTVTPVLILAASLASRRWGEAVGGWFVGLPLTSGPVCFFLALDEGEGFAASAALGCLAGAAAEAGFCLGYGAVARGFGWSVSLAAGSAAYVAAALVLRLAALPLWPLVLAACTALAVVLALTPVPSHAGAASPALPAWDVPARMIVATGLVLGLTALAPYVGGRTSGLVATYPTFAAVLTAFGHRTRGAAAAIQVLRGLMVGLFAFTAFFAVLASTLVRLGVAESFALATLVALCVQGASLLVMQRRR